MKRVRTYAYILARVKAALEKRAEETGWSESQITELALQSYLAPKSVDGKDPNPQQ